MLVSAQGGDEPRRSWCPRGRGEAESSRDRWYAWRVSADPYRVNEPPRAPAPPSPEERLGVVRSVHTLHPLWRALAPAIFVSGVFALLGLSLASTNRVFLVSLPFASVAFGLFAWSPLRARGTVVRLYASGLAVLRRGSIDLVHFDDVDELWYDLDVSSTGVARFARIHALRLVDHHGRTVRVPLVVTDAGPLLSWVTRNCSEHLLPEARRELRAGRPLRFGRVCIDRDTVTVGRRTLRWKEVRLVRLQSGRVTFFRRQTIIPWRTVSLDRVPHPSVFARLVEEAAVRVERDYPFQAG